MRAQLPPGVTVSRVPLQDGRDGLAIRDRRDGQDVTLIFGFDEVLTIGAAMIEIAIDIARGGQSGVIPFEGRVR